MKPYELTILVRIEKDADTIKTIVKEFEGKVTKEEKWGKRELTYPIKKETEAFYLTYQLELKPDSIDEMKKKMNYDEKIIRYLLISRS